MQIINSIIVLKPGVHILRHPKQGLPPLSVGRAPTSRPFRGRIEILSTPSTDGSVLRDGSDCIVMHVIDAEVEIIISTVLEEGGVQIPKLRIDTVGLDPAPTIQSTDVQPTPSPIIEVNGTGLSIIGHIEKRGDIVVLAGQQLGDPESLLRLEGFQLVWPDKPVDVEISYAVTLEGSGANPSVTIGNFCGTRGEARRITGLTMTLGGPNAANYKLHGVANFSGGFQVPLLSGIDVSGPSGFEHLVGLQLNILNIVKSQ